MSLVRVTGINLPSWTGEGWFFDPLAWQFLFIIGVLLACAPLRAAAALVVRPRGRGGDGLWAVVVTLVIEPIRIAGLGRPARSSASW